MQSFRKVVVPVAGWGTRSLPASKNVPKEMLPIYNRPVIQYVMEEALRSGVTSAIFVTNRDKSVIEDYFDYSPQLEAVLQRGGKQDKLAEIRQVAEMLNLMSVRQKQQRGLGHAVLCARDLVANEPFAVMLGDDLMFGSVPGIHQLIEVAQAENMPVVGVMEVPQEEVSKYGIIDGEEIAPGSLPRTGYGGKTCCGQGTFPSCRGRQIRPVPGYLRLSGQGGARSWWRDPADGCSEGPGPRKGDAGDKTGRYPL